MHYDFSDSQLDDEEMGEFLESKRKQDEEEALKERKRMEKARSFKWKGGM